MKSKILACRKTGDKTFETDVQLPDGGVVTTVCHTGSFSHIKNGVGTCDVSWYDARAFYESDHKLVEITFRGERTLVTSEVIAEYTRLLKVAEDYLAAKRAQ